MGLLGTGSPAFAAGFDFVPLDFFADIGFLLLPRKGVSIRLLPVTNEEAARLFDVPVELLPPPGPPDTFLQDAADILTPYVDALDRLHRAVQSDWLGVNEDFSDPQNWKNGAPNL